MNLVTWGLIILNVAGIVMSIVATRRLNRSRRLYERISITADENAEGYRKLAQEARERMALANAIIHGGKQN